MALAFWRRKPKADAVAAPRSARTAPADDDAGRDSTAMLRARARRRLIGAAALLLLVVIVVPMLLDPEPHSIPDNIPIDIPSEKTKFSPRLALPPATENVAPAPPPDAAPPSAALTPSPGDAAPAQDTPRKDAKPAPEAAGRDARATTDAKAEEQRARAALEGKSPGALPSPAKGGKFAVQAAATSTEAAARELSDRLRKAGLSTYTERVQTTDGTRFRVRVGPYAEREDAEKVRARLKSLGISGNVVTT
jgi:DedD protein